MVVPYALFLIGLGLMTAAVFTLVRTSPSPEIPNIPINNGVTVLRPSTSSSAAGVLPNHDDPGSTSTSTTSVTVPPPASRSVDASEPAKPIQKGVRITIPSIGVDASVVSLGLNPDGTLQVPSNFSQAGWWSGGPFPGQPGPAVVVGHVSSVAGPGVFYRLGLLKAGSLVTVSQPSGASATFSVTRVIEVSKSDFPTQLVYGPVTDPQLRLITCGGSFNSSTGHFDDNLIVFANLSSRTS